AVAISEAEPLRGHALPHLLAPGEAVCERHGAVELPVTVPGAEELSAGVDRGALIHVAPQADRIIVLEAEADRVHELMARGAERIFRVLPEPLAGGDAGLHLRRLDLDVVRRGRHGLAQEPLADELPAVDRRRLVRLGQDREQAWLREQAS